MKIALILLLILSGEAQLATQQMLTQSQLEYSSIKRVVLQRISQTPKEHC
ncbi:hypothetical protein Q7C36_022670 [Tachysurus vachellii]|uniref:Myostatin n=1 Tax=Tachysurus vachellii TaxID=175792 RepID=A0AA88J0U8_TACVA|nr:hypothetical protein Q7C36_022670 [Tachysurus vachellii]